MAPSQRLKEIETLLVYAHQTGQLYENSEEIDNLIIERDELEKQVNPHLIQKNKVSLEKMLEEATNWGSYILCREGWHSFTFTVKESAFAGLKNLTMPVGIGDTVESAVTDFNNKLAEVKQNA